MNNQAFTMTDEIERQLMLAALQDQFRPRPFQALAGLVRRVLASTRGRATGAMQAQTA